jgi:hypothetical protein
MELLLKYLYTGSCVFLRDDLQTGVDLLTVACRFMLEPLREYCERIVSNKINNQNVINLYYLATQCNTPILLATTQHFICEYYELLMDKDYSVLLHLLENSTVTTRNNGNSVCI